ncbi:hypothetical protein Tco_0114446 [Tanacetum coccineum]
MVTKIKNNKNNEEVIREEREPNDDHGIGNFDNDFVRDNAPYHANKEDEQCEKDRCELLGPPSSHQELPICKIVKFEVIKYSFGLGEKYIAIKEQEHGDWTRTK